MPSPSDPTESQGLTGPTGCGDGEGRDGRGAIVSQPTGGLGHDSSCGSIGANRILYPRTGGLGKTPFFIKGKIRARLHYVPARAYLDDPNVKQIIQHHPQAPFHWTAAIWLVVTNENRRFVDFNPSKLSVMISEGRLDTPLPVTHSRASPPLFNLVDANNPFESSSTFVEHRFLLCRLAHKQGVVERYRAGSTTETSAEWPWRFIVNIKVDPGVEKIAPFPIVREFGIGQPPTDPRNPPAVTIGSPTTKRGRGRQRPARIAVFPAAEPPGGWRKADG
jgi:hypothetical protein